MEAAEFPKSHEYLHHAFLSYNTRDVQHVKPINDALSKAGLAVYFAPEERGDLELTEELIRKIDDSGCLILFIGPTGVGNTQKSEAKYAQRKDKRVLKVILPGGRADALLETFDSKPLDCTDFNGPYKLIDDLIVSITGMSLARLPLQVGMTPKIKVTNPRSGQSRVLEVHSLCTIDRTKRLLLNWVTFGALVENLKCQVDAYPGFHPEAYFGINPAGLVAVQFLNEHRMPVGFIHHEGSRAGRRIVLDKCAFPKLKGSPVILAVDSQLKSGSGMEIAVDAIKKRYPTSDIYYAVLGAILKEPDGEPTVQKLLGWPHLSKHLEDGSIKDIFIGSIFAEPGIHPPFKIR